MTVFLDTGPLGIITNPKQSVVTIAMTNWALSLDDAGHRIVVPAIADYEIRRELLRGGKKRGLTFLDAFLDAEPNRYLPLTDAALKLAAELWARARNTGKPTGDLRELDCDVLIAAQAINCGFAPGDFIIATTNVGHLSQFATSALWDQIKP